VTHETESPAPLAGHPHADSEEPLPLQRALTEPPPNPGDDSAQHGYVMSPGIPRVQRLHTISGATVPPPAEVPAPPPTEVAPAPDVHPDFARREAAAARAPVPAPRPSETLVGSRAPLHTAEDANTGVDISSLSADDADRILAAADAERRTPQKRDSTVATTSSALPPPPPLRRSNFPPPAAVLEVRPAPKHPEPLPRPRTPAAAYTPPTTLKRTPSAPAPPVPRRANTLLFYGAPPEEEPPTVRGPGLGVAPRTPTVRTPRAEGVSPSAPVLSHPAPRVEELPASALADDSSELRAMRPQLISSSSLVEDPISSPEIEEEPPPLAASPPPRPAAQAPPTTTVASPPAPPPRPLASPAPPRALAPLTPTHQLNPARSRAAAPPPPAFVATPAAFPAPPDTPEPTSDLADGQPSSAYEGPANEPLYEAQASPESTRLRNATTVPPTGAAPDAVAMVLGTAARPEWLVPLLAVGAIATAILALTAMVLVVKWVREPSMPRSVASISSSGALGPTAEMQTSAAAPGIQAKTDESHAGGGAPCVLAGAPHIVAPRALLRTGIEIATTADRIALGVGLDDHDGFAVALDPSTFVASATGHAHSSDTIQRVAPVLAPPEVSPFLVTKRHHGELQAAHPVAGDPPFVIGVSGSKLAWTPSRDIGALALWPLESDAPVDAMHAIVLPNHAGFAVAFRQGASIFLGALHSDKTINGGLARVGGLGPQVGAPTLAAGKERVLVAWADRSSASMPWGIRWLQWQPGSEPAAPTPFPVPRGGGGGAVMSPALAALGGGGFVIAWTEGAGARHVVRAVALDSSEQPLGGALSVSADGVNAGEGTPALTPDGRGAIVFLATPSGSSASVVAVPVICPTGG